MRMSLDVLYLLETKSFKNQNYSIMKQNKAAHDSVQVFTFHG